MHYLLGRRSDHQRPWRRPARILHDFYPGGTATLELRLDRLQELAQISDMLSRLGNQSASFPEFLVAPEFLGRVEKAILYGKITFLVSKSTTRVFTFTTGTMATGGFARWPGRDLDNY